MGICASNQKAVAEESHVKKEVEKEKSKTISASNSKSSSSLKSSTEVSNASSSILDITPYKLLLLGSGESGKSTLFKQLTSLYGRGFTKEDRDDFIPSINDNIFESIKTLIFQSRNTDDEDCMFDCNLDDQAKLIETANQGDNLTKAYSLAIQKLWADQGIKNIFAKRSGFQVPDSARYFLDDLARISRKGYSPTSTDVLMCRDRTTGVTSERLKYTYEDKKYFFDVYDVGGQKSERKAWLNIFKGVNAVLFVVAISEFDQLLFEDLHTNRLTDSLTVFQMVVNSPHFKQAPIVLLFNKVDLFREKLERNVKFTYDGYSGEQTFDAISDYIEDCFEQQRQGDKTIITQWICAVSENLDVNPFLSNIIRENEALACE